MATQHFLSSMILSTCQLGFLHQPPSRLALELNAENPKKSKNMIEGNKVKLQNLVFPEPDFR